MKPICTKEELRVLIETVLREFRFKYVGGGYYRDKNIQKGKRAEVIQRQTWG